MKAIPLILLGTLCLLAGAISALRLENKKKILDDLISSLQRLHILMGYSPQKLDISLKNIAIGSVHTFWLTIASEINSKSVLDAFSSAKHLLPFNGSIIDALENFMQALGKSDREGQKRIIEQLICFLSEEQKALNQKVKSSSKLYMTLGAMGGGALVIVLL